MGKLERRAFAAGAVAVLVSRSLPAWADQLDSSFSFAATLDDAVSAINSLADNIRANVNTTVVDAVELIIHKRCDVDSSCKDTARQVVDAANLWLDVMKGRGHDVPSYIDVGYAIRCAGIESVMNVYAHRAKSRFEGLYQFARLDNKTTFWSVAEDLVGFFNSPDVLSRIQNFKRPRHFGPARLRDRQIFLNPYIQVSASMFIAFELSKYIDGHPQLSTMSPEFKQAWLYLYHNLPKMALIVADNLNSSEPVNALAPASFANIMWRIPGFMEKPERLLLCRSYLISIELPSCSLIDFPPTDLCTIVPHHLCLKPNQKTSFVETDPCRHAKKALFAALIFLHPMDL